MTDMDVLHLIHDKSRLLGPFDVYLTKASWGFDLRTWPAAKVGMLWSGRDPNL